MVEPRLATEGQYMRKLLALAAVIASIAPATAAAAAASPPRLLRTDVSALFAVRPATISFGCCGQVLITGPGVRSIRSGKLGHIRWAQWNRAQGKGHGLYWIDDCTPDCARGRFQSTPVTIEATRVRHDRYTRLLLIYRMGGNTVFDHRTLRRLSGAAGPAYQWL